MRFSANRFYIERYVKCVNCGTLIYESEASAAPVVDGRTYCSDWCVDWASNRDKRLTAAEQGGNWDIPPR